jgi:hypothetical protein
LSFSFLYGFIETIVAEHISALRAKLDSDLLDSSQMIIAEVVGSNPTTRSISYYEGTTALNEAHFLLVGGQKPINKRHSTYVTG